MAVGASLTADLAWYSIGRWRGAQALALIGKLSPRAAARVRTAEQPFVAHRVGALFGARWLPEANPLAAGMAGAAHIAPGRYIRIAMTSALAWVGTWAGAGYALGNVTTGWPMPFGVVPTSLVLAVAIASVGFVLKHRRPAKRPSRFAGRAILKRRTRLGHTRPTGSDVDARPAGPVTLRGRHVTDVRHAAV